MNVSRARSKGCDPAAYKIGCRVIIRSFHRGIANSLFPVTSVAAASGCILRDSSERRMQLSICKARLTVSN